MRSIMLFLAVLFLPACSCGKMAGKVDYCYINSFYEMTSSVTVQTFRLMGHRPWDGDIQIIRSTTLDACVEAANKIQCPLR